MTTEPTHDELAKLFTEETGFDVDDFPAAILDFARAVLAKWGTPSAVAQEPVAHDEDLLEQLYWDFDSQRKKTGEERLAFKGKMRSYASEFRRRSVGQMVFAQSVSDDMMNLADRLGGLPYVDPRAWGHLLVYAPQQEAVPLTDEQLAEMMRETWGCASIAPRHAIGFARAIERHHGIGIKGGQHGAE